MQKKRNKTRLSRLEKEIESALDVEALKMPGHSEQKALKAAAKRTLKELKSARTNIRMDLGDMNAIRDLAKKAGIPYQTFIAHVLHLYVTGQLLNVDEIKKLVASGVLAANKAS